MIHRALGGASGDLYDSNSQACHVALEQLVSFLKTLGFRVRKKVGVESTLRVYIDGRKYPLLNPRFNFSLTDFGVRKQKEALVFTVWSKGLGDSFDHALRTFPSTNQCTFRPDVSDGRTHHLHGFFLLPLRFSGRPGEERIDFGALKSGVIKMRDFLDEHVKREQAPSGLVSGLAKPGRDEVQELIDRLSEAGNRWGFDVKVTRTYSSVTYGFWAHNRRFFGCIVNARSLLFYFRLPLLKVLKNFDQLIGASGLAFALSRQGEYQVRLTNERDCAAVIEFIDTRVVPRLDLSPREDGRPLPIPTPDDIDESAVLLEGATRRVIVNAYERDARARRRCIAHYGLACVVCNFSFADTYGAAGAGLIHVHHVIPLAEIGTEYQVDPVRDLRPVCANCHSIIHRRLPPFNVDEVRGMLSRKP
jgi:hypothetical protein